MGLLFVLKMQSITCSSLNHLLGSYKASGMSHMRRELKSWHFILQCEPSVWWNILFQVDLSTGLAIEEACYAQVSNYIFQLITTDLFFYSSLGRFYLGHDLTMTCMAIIVATLYTNESYSNPHMFLESV